MSNDLSTMDFADRVREIARRQKGRLDSIESEEATKHGLVMPVLMHVLGFNVFEPQEVMPEFIADVGAKRGERVDYAIMKDGKPAVLVECKTCGTKLSTSAHGAQLFRYFTATDARFAALTNGTLWWFYSDIDQTNRMDAEPFFVFDFQDHDANAIEALRCFTKAEFDVQDNASKALELKMHRKLVETLTGEFREPSRDLVRFLAKRVYAGMLTERVMGMFEKITPLAMQSLIGKQVAKGLKNALAEMESIDGPDDEAEPEKTVPTERAKIESPISWGFGDDATSVTYWYEVLDGLVKSHLEANPEGVAELIDPEGVFNGMFFPDPGTRAGETVLVADGLYRLRSLSAKQVLRRSAVLLKLMEPHPAPFRVLTKDDGVYVLDDNGELSKTEAAED